MIRRLLLWLRPSLVVKSQAFKDAYDERDYKYENLETGKSLLPDKLDLTYLQPPITDQSPYNNCTNEAIAAILYQIKNYNLQQSGSNKWDLLFSRFQIWNNARAFEGRYPKNEGVFSRTALTILTRAGLTLSRFYEDETTVSPDSLETDLINHVNHTLVANFFRMGTIDYSRTRNLNSVKDALNKGYGVYMAMAFTPKMVNVGKDGILDCTPSNKFFGHAVSIVGYDDITRLIKVRNSWSKYWGYKGYCYMKYDDFNKPVKDNVIYDLYIIREK